MRSCTQGLLTVSVLVLVSVGVAVNSAVAVEPVFPGASWQTIDPNEVGMDAAKLTAFANRANGSGLVIRHGYIVKTWGSIDTPPSSDLGWASASKSVLSTLMLFAANEGLTCP